MRLFRTRGWIYADMPKSLADLLKIALKEREG